MDEPELAGDLGEAAGVSGTSGPIFTPLKVASKLHFEGSDFWLVAPCRKWSLFTSSLSTRIEPSGTLAVSGGKARLHVEGHVAADTRELTAVIRSPSAASNTAEKLLLPVSGLTVKSSARAAPATASEAAQSVRAETAKLKARGLSHGH